MNCSVVSRDASPLMRHPDGASRLVRDLGGMQRAGVIMQRVSRSRILRSSLGRVFYSTVGGLLIGLPLIVVAAVYASSDPGTPPAGLVAGLTALVLVGAFALRLALVRVVLHDDHIQLVNPLRSFRYYWNDVEDIDIISSAGWIVRVWAGGVPRWAWGASQIGQFGAVPFSSVHDDPAKDAPRRVHDGYRQMRTAWKKGRDRITRGE